MLRKQIMLTALRNEAERLHLRVRDSLQIPTERDQLDMVI